MSSTISNVRSPLLRRRDRNVGLPSIQQENFSLDDSYMKTENSKEIEKLDEFV